MTAATASSAVQAESRGRLSEADTAVRTVITLERDWRFILGDPAGAETPEFDDASWRPLQVPHDWAFEAPFEQNAAQTEKGGYKPGGVGWYRLAFEIPEGDAGREIRVEFDGVYMNSEAWLNGRKLGKRPYGYISFGYDATPHAKAGRNLLAVRVDNSREPSARWYHGCGIYAPVRLVIASPLRVAPWGVVVLASSIGTERAEVVVKTEIQNRAASAGRGRLRTRLLSPEGALTAEAEVDFVAPAEGGIVVSQNLTVPNPQRWDIVSPRLYSAVSDIIAGKDSVGGDKRPTDRTTTRFGIREVRWEAATGFWLNGRNVKLLGVCEHLEGGPVGAAWPEALIRWKLELLKRMGANAVRTAHNPQVPRFYELCDELGILVMDEIFDGWKRKADQDYGAQAFDEWWERDLRDWLRRDRNHPSVVIWSVGNETQGPMAKDIVRVCHEVDPTRLVTSGFSGPEAMDVLGVNGHSERQRFFREHKAERPFIATEAPHTWQVRGYYRTQTWWRDGFPNRNQDPFPIPNLTPKEIFVYDWAPAARKTSAKQVFNSSYDNATVRLSARKNWELMRDLPWFSGHFRWTGFDYLGEAGYVHGGWPFRAFMGGALDLAGFEKDLYYLYQSQWTEAPMVHLLPHWTHPRMEPGTEIPVVVYSNAAEVELFQDGRSLGHRRPGRKEEDMACTWLVPWKPGVVEAVAFRDGREVARAAQRTAGSPETLSVTTDRSAFAANGRDVAVVTIAQVDRAGTLYPYGENRVAFRLEGPARLLSLENGNPVDTEPNWGVTSRRAFFGLVRAFVQATREPGDVALVVGAISGERRQLTSDQVCIDVRRLVLRGAGRVGTAAAAGSAADVGTAGSAGGAWRITYTTDGSAPTPSSTLYAGPFKVGLGTRVRALVCEAGREVLSLDETFAADAGLHWPAPGEKTTVGASGLQAEDATLVGATRGAEIGDHSGTGYAVVSRGGSVTWYQENDGSPGPVRLVLRYGMPRGAAVPTVTLSVNGKPVTLPALAPVAEGKWGTLSIDARQQSGANHFRLEVVDGGALLVDELVVGTAEGTSSAAAPGGGAKPPGKAGKKKRQQ